VKSRLRLDVVVLEGASVLKLLPRKDQTLLVRWDSLLVLDLRLHGLNGVASFDLKSDGLSSEGLHKDLHATTETENQVEGGLFLDVVVLEGTAVLELLASEDEALLVGWDSFLVLDLRFDGLDGVTSFHLKGNGLASEGLDEDLHSTTETEDQVEGRFFLDVVVLEGTPVLELLASEDQTLLVGGNSFLVLDFRLDGLDGVASLNFKGDCLAGKSLDENLHTTTETEDQVEGGLFLDVVILEGTAILELLASKDEALLVRSNPLFVLDLRLDRLDGVGSLNLQGNGFASEGLDKDLHSTTETEDQVEGGLLLYVVVLESATVL